MLTRTNRLFGPLTDELERTVNGLFNAWPLLESGSGLRAFPPINVWEDDDKLYAEAEVPGLSMNDIEIVVLGNELTLRGQRGDKTEEKTVYHRRERGTGAFQRVIRLPVDIDAEQVAASLKNGVLMITLPKAPTAKPRKIEVKVANG